MDHVFPGAFTSPMLVLNTQFGFVSVQLTLQG
jgi:hypothetical protein